MQMPVKIAIAASLYSIIVLSLAMYSWKLTQIHDIFGVQIKSIPIVKRLAAIQISMTMLVCIAAPIYIIYPSMAYGALTIPIGACIYVFSGAIRSSIIDKNYFVIGSRSTSYYHFIALKDSVSCTGLIAGLIFYSNWISCGCWENKVLKIGATILVYTLSMLVLLMGKFKSTKFWVMAISGISVAVFCAFMGHYILPFPTIPRFSDNIFVAISSIPLIGTMIFMMACLNSQSVIVYRRQCNEC